MGNSVAGRLDESAANFKRIAAQSVSQYLSSAPFLKAQLLQNQDRNDKFFCQLGGDILLDYCRQLLDEPSLDILLELATEKEVSAKIKKMFAGEKINKTENRAALHVALRAPKDVKIFVDGVNVVEQVHSVLSQIEIFSEQVRSASRTGVTGKPLTSVVCVGIGGSYLGPEFVYETLATYGPAQKSSEGRILRFLANVDPIDFRRVVRGLNPENTLVIVVSKTFTTAETMMNAKVMREWLWESLGVRDGDTVAKHMAAVSTALDKTSAFGISPENVFGFWDWVGGRFSVCSAVGVLSLSIHYGYKIIVNEFLAGARFIDEHFLMAADNLRQNIPAMLGILAFYNSSVLGFSSTAVLPYTQSLIRFVAHVQQLDMESNGKVGLLSSFDEEQQSASTESHLASFPTGMIHFGEPGTNGQHSFYQLLHQGRKVPAEFIGFCRSQQIPLSEEKKSVGGEAQEIKPHDELMCNFFAQADALAVGKSVEDLNHEKCPQQLVPHKLFSGDRPSVSLMLPECTAFWTGALLAIYEHRTAVQSWMWGTNAFDQWGVELGKSMAGNVRSYLTNRNESTLSKFNFSTKRLLRFYNTHQ